MNSKFTIHTGLFSNEAKNIFDFVHDILIPGFYPNSSGRSYDTRNSLLVKQNPDGEVVLEINGDRYYYRSAFQAASVKTERHARIKFSNFIYRIMTRGIRVRNCYSDSYRNQWVSISGAGKDVNELVFMYDGKNLAQEGTSYANYRYITWGQLALIRAIILGQKRILKGKAFKKILEPLVGKQRDPMLTEMVQSSFSQMEDAIRKLTEDKKLVDKECQAAVNKIYTESQEKQRKMTVDTMTALSNMIEAVKAFGITEIPSTIQQFMADGRRYSSSY